MSTYGYLFIIASIFFSYPITWSDQGGAIHIMCLSQEYLNVAHPSAGLQLVSDFFSYNKFKEPSLPYYLPIACQKKIFNTSIKKTFVLPCYMRNL